MGVMDVWLGAHVPEGKASLGDPSFNYSDEPGYRRVARRQHLNRLTNAAFMDGHGAPIKLRATADHVANYAFWLKTMGVKEPQKVAAADPDLN